MTIEQQVSETILEEKKQITIGGETYDVAPPSIATLILFSKYVSQLPTETLKEENPLASMLAQADKLHHVGYALAAIILGKEEFEKPYTSVEIKRNWLRKDKVETKISEHTQGKILAMKINKADITQVLNVYYDILRSMKLRDFFQLTTSLTELNLTKQTKTEEVVNEMTASGQL